MLENSCELDIAVCLVLFNNNDSVLLFIVIMGGGDPATCSEVSDLSIILLGSFFGVVGEFSKDFDLLFDDFEPPV